MNKKVATRPDRMSGHDLEQRSPPGCAKNLGCLLELARNFIDEALGHPYGVGQRGQEIDQYEPDTRVEQAESGVVER
jgi:hypothetical protein